MLLLRNRTVPHHIIYLACLYRHVTLLSGNWNRRDCRLSRA